MLDKAEKWVAINGNWDINTSKIFTGSQGIPGQSIAPVHYGLILCSTKLRDGKISADITCDFDDEKDISARIVFGFNSSTESYYSIGLGGYGAAYVLSEFTEGKSWIPKKVVGNRSMLKSGVVYHLQLTITGQTVLLEVDDVTVFKHSLPTPINGDQVGLFAWGQKKVTFDNVTIESQTPKAFIVTQFSEPFESLYEEVIKPVVGSDQRIEAVIASDVSKPGIILDDIVDGLKESTFIIAEITPTNANVFYELGYAHALDKPVILLAERNTKLPFDVSGYRCIFYDNTIKGKREVEETLKKHINTILN